MKQLPGKNGNLIPVLMLLQCGRGPQGGLVDDVTQAVYQFARHQLYVVSGERH